MTDKQWEQQLSSKSCDRCSVVARFYDDIHFDYIYQRKYDYLAYHRDIYKFVDIYCGYGHLFTKRISRMLYGILDHCFDVSIYRKLYSHGMKVYAFNDDDSYLIASSFSHMIAFIEADVKNVFVKQEIDSIPFTYMRKKAVENTIGLSFLIEA